MTAEAVTLCFDSRVLARREKHRDEHREPHHHYQILTINRVIDATQTVVDSVLRIDSTYTYNGLSTLYYSLILSCPPRSVVRKAALAAVRAGALLSRLPPLLLADKMLRPDDGSLLLILK